MSTAEPAARPFCAEQARAVGEPLNATASRIEHWLLVEYGGHWPFDPLDAAPFAGSLRGRLAAQLERLPRSRLCLVKQAGRTRRREGARVLSGLVRERGSRFHQLEVGSLGDLAELDLAGALLAGSPLGEPVEHPLLLACTHGTRDRCCARYGQDLCRGLARLADPEWAWQATHVGGDRFAGNLVAFPEGLYFGRVGSAEVGRVLDLYRAGRIDLEHYRGRSCHAFPEQAADAFVRAHTGLTGLYDLRLLGRRPAGPGAWHVELLAEVAGVVHEVEVVRELGEPRPLTCEAAEPREPRRFVVRGHRTREPA